MQVDIDSVINLLCEKISVLSKDNAILQVLVSQLEAEVELLRASQVQEKTG